MKLFKVANTTWENLQIATHKSVSFTLLNWFVLCNLQIFSGCVCHLEELHAQFPFLFPIVFGINLISFFNIGSVLLTVLRSGLLSFTWATARSLLVALSLLVTSQISPSCPIPSQTKMGSTMGESIRPSFFYNSTLSANKHARRTNLPLFAIGGEPSLSTAIHKAQMAMKDRSDVPAP